MTNEAAIQGGTPDASVIGSSSTPEVADSSAATSPSPAPSEQTASTASAGADQGSTLSEPDVLTGVPSLDELNALPEDSQYKKSLIQMRTAIDNQFKPQLNELTTKLKPFESVVDRFTTPEEVQETMGFKDQFLSWERDSQNQLIPATETTAKFLTEKYPLHADYLAADLMEQVINVDGRETTRLDLALAEMKNDPQRRATALRLLGGVEPTAIAPTWQASAEELAVIPNDPDRITPEEKSLQEIYGKLPYDERESLKLNDPEFIRNYLKKEKFQQDLMAQNQQAQERETRQQQQREQYIQQQAQDAGNKYVEQGFRQGMTEFANSIVERSKFIAPLDPNSEAARQMVPEQVQAYNAQAEQINTGVGKMVAVVTAALSHPDTAWVAADFLKGLGVEPQVLDKFNSARSEYALNARNYGELNFTQGMGQNGTQSRIDLGSVQANANSAMKNMKGYGNAVSAPLFDLLSKFFEMKAGSYNQTLNAAPPVRPSVGGTAYDPTRETTQRQRPDPGNIYNRTDIEQLAYR